MIIKISLIKCGSKVQLCLNFGVLWKMRRVNLNLVIFSTLSVSASREDEAPFSSLSPPPPPFSSSSRTSLWHSQCWQDRLCPLWSRLQCCGNRKTTPMTLLPGLLLGARGNGPKPDQRNSVVLLWKWPGTHITRWKALQIYISIISDRIRRSLLRIHVRGTSSTGRLLILDSPMRFIRWDIRRSQW